MTTLILSLLVTLLAAGYGAGLVRTVHRDGLGHRQPPRSHHDWSDDWRGGTPAA